MDNQEYTIGELVLYKNNQLIAFNKPPALAVQPDKTGDKSLMDLASIYAKSKVFLIHRIDRPASGIVLFGKNPMAQTLVSEQFRNREIRKIYLAVVGQQPPQPEGNLLHFLKKDQRQNRTKVFDQEVDGAKRAELNYRLTGSIDNYHLLEIELITGRHHQVRAQLAAIGCPLKGDVKYGFRRANRDRSIHLHAWKLFFSHPVSGEEQEIVAPLPDETVWKAFGVA